MSVAAGLALHAGLAALPAVLLACIEVGALSLAAGLATRAVAGARAALARASPVTPHAFPVHAGGGVGATVPALAAVVRIGPDPDAAPGADDVAVRTHAAAPAPAAAPAADEGLRTAAVPARGPTVRADADLAISPLAALRLPGAAAVSAALVATPELELLCCPGGGGDQPSDGGPGRGRSGEELAADKRDRERRWPFR